MGAKAPAGIGGSRLSGGRQGSAGARAPAATAGSPDSGGNSSGGRAVIHLLAGDTGLNA
jgi:hypothetical protein